MILSTALGRSPEGVLFILPPQVSEVAKRCCCTVLILGAFGRYEGLVALLLGARTVLGTKGIATRSKDAIRPHACQLKLK